MLVIAGCSTCWVHRAPALLLFGTSQGVSSAGVLPQAALPLLFAVAAAILARGPRRLSTVVAALGLMVSAAGAVSMAQGATEAHFLFFVLIPLLVLYEDWVPFLVAFAIRRRTSPGVRNARRVHALRPSGRCRAAVEVGADPWWIRGRREHREHRVVGGSTRTSASRRPARTGMRSMQRRRSGKRSSRRRSGWPSSA